LQLVTPAPYAVFAAGVGTVAGSALSGTYGGAVTFSNTGNSFSGNGAGLIGLNAAQLTSGTVPPAALGNVWKTGGNSGTTPDSNFLGTTDNQPLELRVNNTRGLRLEANTNGAPNLIGGAPVNYVASGVGGATIAGGGGADLFNRYTNRVTADFGTVSGGRDNSARNYAATVGGGYLNAASGFAATIPGGQQNVASGNQSFAAGIRANAVHDGSFVWSDRSSLDPFFSTAENQFSVRAGGGIRLAGNLQLDEGDYRYLSLSGGNSLGYIYGSFPALGDGVHLAYNHYYNKFGSSQILHNDGATSRLTVGYGFVGLYVGGVGAAPVTQRLLATSSGITVNGTFNNQSDRNAKQDFAPINSAQILEKVARLPLSEWSYKDDPATRHLGPVAQDFRAAFEIGTDDRHIAPLDEGGVALAAIQGLNQRMEEQRAELKEKEMEITELKQRLDALEKILRGQKTD
jgi:hypothetical protein